VDVDVDVDVDGAVVEMKEEEICTQYKLCDHLLAVLAVSALLCLLCSGLNRVCVGEDVDVLYV